MAHFLKHLENMTLNLWLCSEMDVSFKIFITPEEVSWIKHNTAKEMFK